MADYMTEDIRNMALVGHGGVGKTTLLEIMLNQTGATTRIGRVEDGSTVSDFDEEEKKRGHSIDAAIAYIDTDGRHINLIDTPGYPDFCGAALSCLGAVETAAIVISASAGIEVNTRRMAAAAKDAGMARIIIVNKIDADNVDLDGLLEQIVQTFGPQCKPMTLPADDGKAVIDCFAKAEGQSDIGDVADAHTNLTESIVEADDTMMERYLGGEKIDESELRKAFAAALTAGTVVPVFFTSARNQVGVKELMSAIAQYAPSPGQGKQRELVVGEGEEATVHPIEVKSDGPLLGRVFKVSTDPFVGKLCVFRILSGTLAPDTQFAIDEERKTVKAGHLFQLQGKEHQETQKLPAGDIGGVAKLEDLHYGSIMRDAKGLIGAIEDVKFPEPMYSLAVSPKARGDEGKISGALNKLDEEDPCFRVSRDRQTHEMVISGIGDLHLRVMLSRMKERFNLEVDTKPPKIPYLETITVPADGHYRHKKQTGGAGQFGEVYLHVEPLERGADPSLEWSWDIFGGSIPGQYEPAIRKGVDDLMEQGAVAGFPLQDIKVSITDGKHHPVDSKEVAFRLAGKYAFRDAILKAKPALLEPIVDMEITVPSHNMGDITGDLNSRRGRVMGMDAIPGDMSVIKAQAPLAEVLQYNSQLKSVTAGQGSYSMELSHYEPVPPQVQQQIIASHKPQADKED